MRLLILLAACAAGFSAPAAAQRYYAREYVLVADAPTPGAQTPKTASTCAKPVMGVYFGNATIWKTSPNMFAANNAEMIDAAQAYCETMASTACRVRIMAFGPPIKYVVDTFNGTGITTTRSSNYGSGASMCTPS